MFAIQFELYSRKDLKFIPSSTFYSIKKRDLSGMLTIKDIDPCEDETLHLLKLAAQKAYKPLISVIRLKNALLTLLKPKSGIKKQIRKKARADRKLKRYIVRTIQRVQDIISLKKACRIFGISVQQFHSWLKQISAICPFQPRQICPKSQPNQLSPREVKTMQTTLTNSEYSGWPVNSIALDALRKGIVHAGLSTWYKYAREFEFSSQTGKNRRKNHAIGIRAVAPNSIIHIDITQFENRDKSISYIYFAYDNFSRFILSHSVETRVSSAYCLGNIQNALKTVREHYPERLSGPLSIMSDGGPENDNFLIRNFLAENSIRLVIAQVDVSESNSMIEAYNKTIKYRWLYLHDSPNHSSTIELVKQYVEISNTKRPLKALEGLIPFEAYTGQIPPKDQWRLQLLTQKTIRLEQNRVLNCSSCLFSGGDYVI